MANTEKKTPRAQQLVAILRENVGKKLTQELVDQCAQIASTITAKEGSTRASTTIWLADEKGNQVIGEDKKPVAVAVACYWYKDWYIPQGMPLNAPEGMNIKLPDNLPVVEVGEKSIRESGWNEMCRVGNQHWTAWNKDRKEQVAAAKDEFNAAMKDKEGLKTPEGQKRLQDANDKVEFLNSKEYTFSASPEGKPEGLMTKDQVKDLLTKAGIRFVE